jgi:hypothetical protein
LADRFSGAFIPLLANTASTIDIGALVGQAAGGGVAGAILTAVVGLIKNKMAYKRSRILGLLNF